MQTEINLHDYALQVQRMRDTQKEYFRFRTKTLLQRCIALEKKVDDISKSIITDTPIIEQKKLFL